MSVTVAGPLRQTEQITADLFTAQVDLSAYGPGEWELIPVLKGPSADRFPGVVYTLQEQHVQATLTDRVAEEPKAGDVT